MSKKTASSQRGRSRLSGRKRKELESESGSGGSGGSTTTPSSPPRRGAAKVGTTTARQSPRRGGRRGRSSDATPTSDGVGGDEGSPPPSPMAAVTVSPPVSSSRRRSTRRSASMVKSYAEDDHGHDDDEDERSDDDEGSEKADRVVGKSRKAKPGDKKKSARGGNKTEKSTATGRGKGKGKGKTAAKKADDNDDDGSTFSLDGSSESEEEDGAAFDTESSDDEDFEDAVGPKSKSGRATAAGKKSKPKPKKKTGGDNDGGGDEDVPKSEYKVKNNPQGFRLPFVEPVGIDPTDGIVEGIVLGQVKKIGRLLRMAREDEAPLRLQTACSGTDAPSIAMGIVKECLDKIREEADSSDGGGDDAGGEPASSPAKKKKTKAKAKNAKKNVTAKKGSDGATPSQGFSFDHVMSCEIDPFKQAYISRNFPGVTLYPDITKLTDGDEVADVYGRSLPVPRGDLFVAGTSCKDFSMLRTTTRKDIEDKGQSGETFLAAVEFLEKFLPEYAIFENVMGAPWLKMQEYITGRLFLGTAYDKKNITAGNGKGAKDLVFVVDDDSRYIVEEVPRQMGVKAGSIVQGYCAEGKGAEIAPLKADKKDRGKTVTLAQLAKKHKVDMEEDTLVFHKNARYCTKLVELDTKSYGLPQTRNRRYLFVWRSDDFDDNLGEYFKEILTHLETPLIHPIDAFLLSDTHDRVRNFREALRSHPGLVAARQRAREINFFEGPCKDKYRHMDVRKSSGVSRDSRMLTGWSDRGRKALAPNIWPELADVWDMRRLDLIDTFGALATRDSVSRDALHHCFTWNISQNVSREPFRAADVGVCGCVSPGGEIFLPHLGRAAMGSEKLLLQGIPFSRLLLGNETEVQLGDLAGNAMSLPVVCATMLAAMCAKQLRKDRQRDDNIPLHSYRLVQKHDAAAGAVLPERGDLTGAYSAEKKQKRGMAGKSVVDAFSDAVDLADDAHKSSVLCTCETSGRTTDADDVFECKGCGLSICQNCCEKCRTDGHDLAKSLADADGDADNDNDELERRQRRRVDPPEFERRLRRAFPATLRLGSGAETILSDGDGLESYSFQLQRVSRKRGFWEMVYGAKEDYGCGRQVAEIRVVIGRIGTLAETGLCAYVKCFAPAVREQNPQGGILRDSARLILVKGDDIGNGGAKWESPDAVTSAELHLVGSGETPSQRVLMGIGDDARKSLKGHKYMKRFIPTHESRNNHLWYEKNWKVWPSSIEVSSDPSGRVNGTYEKLSCKQTIVHSALWRRSDGDGSPSMYLIIRPDVNRTSPDTAVFSPTPNYRDKAEIVELDDWIPENTLDPEKQKTSAKLFSWKTCDLRVEVLADTLAVASPKEFVADIAEPRILCTVKNIPRGSIDSLLIGTEHGKTVATLPLFGGSVGTRTTKRLQASIAPTLLKHAAEGGLPVTMNNVDAAWIALPTEGKQFGSCQIHVPLRPVEHWKEIREGRLMERFSDPEESRDYYLALHNRPKAWLVKVDRIKGNLNVFMNPFVGAHHAAAPLVLGRGADSDVDISYRLTEVASMKEPTTKEFHVPNSDAYEETHIQGLTHSLYPRQAKALTRMRAIEDGEVMFREEERSEHVLPGVGWCLIAKASRKAPLRGGVLADAIGSGKTVISIALILADIVAARKSKNEKRGISGATLVAVPPGLVSEWDEQRKKFTEDKLKCIQIMSTKDLAKYSVSDLCRADMVLVPVDILEDFEPKKKKERPYLENLVKKSSAGLPIPPAPAGYGKREAATIAGVWVPVTSQTPYGNNEGNQQKRNFQAYYTHCYSNALSKLREKSFSPSEKGVPLEYFTWRRIVVDECHQALCTAKGEDKKTEEFDDTGSLTRRRAARELLGIAQTDATKRPLRATMGVWGLTGTPLLSSEPRVVETANLMGGTYLTGAAHHWRKEERESGRDLFLNQQEGARSREYRCAVQDVTHTYVHEACQRNRRQDLGVEKETKFLSRNMRESDWNIIKSEAENPENVATLTDEELSSVLGANAKSAERASAFVEELRSIQSTEPKTKIIAFADVRYGGHAAACQALENAGIKFAFIGNDETVEKQNEIMSWFRHEDVTEEEKARPRIILLSYEQAAGHNLQQASHHVILYDPVYSGSDAVTDASVEEQAIGRVYRLEQTQDVTVIRIVLKSPNGKPSIDDWVFDRNTDEEVLAAATSNFD